MIVGSAMKPTRLAATVMLIVTLAACAGAANSSASPVPSIDVSTPEEAAARVAAVVPELAGIGRQDPNLVGGCCWWEASETGDGFEVTFEVGWGDCPAGCIDRHRWVYQVGRDGSVELVDESGPAVPSGVPGAGIGDATGGGIVPGGTGVTGTVTAGPTCPVVSADDPNCADQPVAGVTILILDHAGTEVARLTTDEAGMFAAQLPPGPYVIEPQPVRGYLRTAEPVAIEVRDGVTHIDLAYDTGIR